MANPVGNPNWLAGNSGNPKGRPPGVFHTLSDKRSHFLETLSRGQILEIVTDDKKLDEYTAFEAQVLLGLAETLMETPDNKLDPSAAREKLYDRELGKPGQPLGGGSENPALQVNITQQILAVMTLDQLEAIKKQVLISNSAEPFEAEHAIERAASDPS